MKYLRNRWYVAGWASELTAEAPLLGRTILDEPIVFFRNGPGIGALRDQCPHRFSPLRLGSVTEGILQCPYHGLAFGADGECVRNPQGPVPKAARVRAYPACEAHSMLWVWMGAPEMADPARIPDFSCIGAAPATVRTPGYSRVDAHYELLNDNLMDLSHVDFLHRSTFSQGSLSAVRPQVSVHGEAIRILWKVLDAEPSVINKPHIGDVKRIDIDTEVVWHAAGNMRLSITMRPTGGPSEPALLIQGCHMMTPESATSTHYFHCGTRNFAVDDLAMTAQRVKIARRAFDEEDKPMIEAVQRSMGADTDLLGRHPMLLGGDGGAVRVRRALKEMLAAEEMLRAG
jgi:phenylpropionate dioxygenase-like ring-hydroxylating dioxygenase large terminal subunit